MNIPIIPVMPCSACGTPWLVSHKYEKLYCPDCLGIEVVNPQNAKEEIENARQFVSEDRTMDILKNYDKNHLLLLLMDELNRISHAFYDGAETGLPVRKFAYISYLMKLIYERGDFGTEYFEHQEEGLPKDIELILEWIDRVIRRIDQVEDGFRYAVSPPVSIPSSVPFVGEYVFFDSEYRYCFQRCLRSLIGGHEEEMDLFFEVHEETRSFERTDVDEIDSLEDLTGTFFEIIVTMAFMFSVDNTLNEIYYTSLPEKMDAFDLKDLLNCIDSQFSDEGIAQIDETGMLPVAGEEGVDNCGESIFGSAWGEAKSKLVVGESNLDAHPFLFKIIRERVVAEPAGRPPVTVDEPIILYPRYYNQLIRFQLFPFLENGDSPDGEALLDNECEKRGRQFEQNLFNHLIDRGYECYLSAWFTKSDQREIDLIVVNYPRDELWFIECKFLLPATHMRTVGGVSKLNQKFDSKVFKEETEHYDAESGEPFPEKVRIWLNQKDGQEFLSHVGPDGENRQKQVFQEKWGELDPRMIVVSNVVPSYIEKQGVEFLTDIEFLELLNDELGIYTGNA